MIELRWLVPDSKYVLSEGGWPKLQYRVRIPVSGIDANPCEGDWIKWQEWTEWIDVPRVVDRPARRTPEG